MAFTACECGHGLVMSLGFVCTILTSFSSFETDRSQLPLFGFSWWDDKGTFQAGDTTTIKVKVLENADKIDKKNFNPTLTVNGKEGNSSYVSTVLSDFEGDLNEWKIFFTPIRVGLFNVLISEERYKVDHSSLHFQVEPGSNKSLSLTFIQRSQSKPRENQCKHIPDSHTLAQTTAQTTALRQDVTAANKFEWHSSHVNVVTDW
ncbi:hypothetical protein V8G54_037865 (chloroplast) [Vigna mungo]|uniref:GEX2 N-terminal Ig-like domain-containing protein n=1 Tax=Vigna mungo TaxID=3915 RepID=A0AAQ3MDA6_VIGMU